MTGAIVSRQAAAAPAPRPQLSEALREADAISKATGLLPSAYANKPGAVLLVMEWARNNGLSTLEALQGVSVVEGKIFVGANLRTRLAGVRGFEFRPVEISPERCEIEVIGTAHDENPRVVVTIQEVNPRLTTKSGAPTPWSTHPADMLFATACRRADKYYVQTAASAVDVRADWDDEGEILPEPQSEPQKPAEQPPAEPEIVDAEIVEVGAPTLEQLKERAADRSLKQASLLKAVRALDYNVSGLDDIADNEEARLDLADWIDQQ